MSDVVWDQVASWWQEKFTEGADPEYEEQIIPLISGDLELRKPVPAARCRNRGRSDRPNGGEPGDRSGRPRPLVRPGR